MHTFELLKLSKEHLEKIQNNSHILDAAYRISGAYKDMPNQISIISSGVQNNMGTATAHIKAQSDSVRSIVTSISPREIFKSIEGMHDCLSAIAESDKKELEDTQEAANALQEFSENYEKYITSYKPTDAPALVFSSLALVHSLEKLISCYKFILRNLENSTEQTENENLSELSLYISNIYGLKDFAEKLNAISDIYEALAELIDIDTTTTPLIIDQIESGSLWSKLFGDSRVITLMIDFLRSGAAFMHRNYTTEGKVISLPSKLESLDKIVDLSGRLREQGIDTTEINEELRRAAVGIAKGLNKLIEHQHKIEINGKTQSIADEFLKGLSDESWLRPRLSHDERREPPLSLNPPED